MGVYRHHAHAPIRSILFMWVIVFFSHSSNDSIGMLYNCQWLILTRFNLALLTTISCSRVVQMVSKTLRSEVARNNSAFMKIWHWPSCLSLGFGVTVLAIAYVFPLWSSRKWSLSAHLTVTLRSRHPWKKMRSISGTILMNRSGVQDSRSKTSLLESLIRLIASRSAEESLERSQLDGCRPEV